MASVVLLVELSLIVNYGSSVAPGDEHQSACETLRAIGGAAPTPDYSANMRVLMDSWNYQNLLPPRLGAVWDQVDNDMNNFPEVTTNWIQQSNTPCQQNVQVCGFSAGPQDNWLITQLINRTVNGTRLPQINVMIEFEMLGCDIALNCHRVFNTHIYETSTENSAAARNINSYRQVQRVSPDVTTGTRVTEIITYVFNTNHSSFYFAIKDETTCVVVTRVIVFYHICPNQNVNLISHPETIAPAIGQSTVVTASCVMNAEPVNGLVPRGLVCITGGVWSHVPSGARCRCVDGHFHDIESCRPCPAGTYLSPSNNSCSTCPANSVSEEEGLTQCTCLEGYYKATQGEDPEDLPCHSPPSPPRNLSIVERTETSITVAWDPPIWQPANCNLTYSIYTSINDGPRVKTVQIVDQTVAVILNLLPGESYTVYISSENCITDQLSENQLANITASIDTSTLETKTVSLAAVTVPPLFVSVLTMIAILTVVVLIIARQKKVKTATVSKQEEVYYSAIEPPSILVKHTIYEEISTLEEYSLTENVNSNTKTSPQKFYSKVSGFEAQDPDPVLLNQNPAYGTNTIVADRAPNINTEKNKAYGYL